MPSCATPRPSPALCRTRCMSSKIDPLSVSQGFWQLPTAAAAAAALPPPPPLELARKDE